MMDIDRAGGDMSGGVWWGLALTIRGFLSAQHIAALLDVAAGAWEKKTGIKNKKIEGPLWSAQGQSCLYFPLLSNPQQTWQSHR